MKVAVQTLSQSTADALRYCEAQKIEGFEGVEATAEFIEIFNDIFDILNSSSPKMFGSKAPLNGKNIEATRLKMKKYTTYICGLLDNKGSHIYDCDRFTGFIGVLSCFEAISKIYDQMQVDTHFLRFFKFVLT